MKFEMHCYIQGVLDTDTSRSVSIASKFPCTAGITYGGDWGNQYKLYKENNHDNHDDKERTIVKMKDPLDLSNSTLCFSIGSVDSDYSLVKVVTDEGQDITQQFKKAYNYKLKNRKKSLTINLYFNLCVKLNTKLNDSIVDAAKSGFMLIGAGSAISGTSISIKEAHNNLKYKFIGWYRGDSLISENSNYKFTVNDKTKGTYTAAFLSKNNLSIYKSFNNNTPSLIETIPGKTSGDTIRLEAQEEQGYNFKGWYKLIDN